MAPNPDSEPFVSVVVAFHFGRDIVRPCIESLLQQDYPTDRYEIIMVDNGSTDGTDAIVSEYPVRLLHERQRRTAYAGLNLGIEHARGEIVAITGADCTADRGWLSQLARHFVDDNIVGVAGVIAPLPSESLIAQFQGGMARNSKPPRDELLAVPTGNVAYRRQALLLVGMFNEEFTGGGDVDLSWRIQAHTGARIVYTRQAIVLHRYPTTPWGLFKHFRRNGHDEMVLTALHKGKPYHQRTPRNQLISMLRQGRALITYVGSSLFRAITWPFHRRDRKYLLWPMLWLVAESGNLLGKLQGLVATRGFRRVVYEKALNQSPVRK